MMIRVDNAPMPKRRTAVWAFALLLALNAVLLVAQPGLALQEYFRSYDVHPDGKRFLMLSSGGVDATSLNVIFNWAAEMTERGARR